MIDETILQQEQEAFLRDTLQMLLAQDSPTGFTGRAVDLAEGIAREVVNRVQNMRKERGLNVGDRIGIQINAPQEIKLAIEQNIDYICSETLSESLTFDNGSEGMEPVEFDDVKMGINILKHE